MTPIDAYRIGQHLRRNLWGYIYDSLVIIGIFFLVFIMFAVMAGIV